MSDVVNLSPGIVAASYDHSERGWLNFRRLTENGKTVCIYLDGIAQSNGVIQIADCEAGYVKRYKSKIAGDKRVIECDQATREPISETVYGKVEIEVVDLWGAQ